MAAPGTILLSKSFLGVAGHLSTYISDYAELVLPLRETGGDSAKYTGISGEWTPRRLRAPDTLKAALVKAPVLAAPVFSKPWIILTDCSEYSMGACLAPLDENVIQGPVTYASVNLAEAQKKTTVSSIRRDWP